MSIPKGGLPQGYSYMVGTPEAPGPHQACLHANAVIRYYLGKGPLDGYVVTRWPNSSWKGPTITPEVAGQVLASWSPDLSKEKFIKFSDAINYVKQEDVLDWYTNTTNSKLYRLGVQGLDEPSRIAVAAIAAIEDAADIRAYAQEKRNVGANSTVIYGGPDYVSPAGMTSQLMTVIGRYRDIGPLPEDHDGHGTISSGAPYPEVFLSTDQGRVPTDSNGVAQDDPSVPVTRTIYFYRFDQTKVNDQGVVTDPRGFCNYGFALMVRDTSKNWHFYKAGAGNSGFFALNEFTNGFEDVPGVGQFLEDEAETIADVIVAVVELVIDVYTAGASASIFATINPLLFGAIKAATTGDTSGIFSALSSTVEYLVGKGAGQVADFIMGSPAAANFILGSKPPQPGVGTAISNAFNAVAAQVAKAEGYFDNTVTGVTAIESLFLADQNRIKNGQIPLMNLDAVGHGVLHNAFDMASQVAKGYFPAVTKEFAGTIQTSLGGVGTVGDYFFAIGNDYVAKRTATISNALKDVSDPKQYVDQAKQHISALVDETMQLHSVPDYAKNALYLGAMVATAAAVQGNVFVPDPTIRLAKQSTTQFNPGYVPPELQTAIAASNDLANQVFVQGSVQSLSAPTARSVLAANSNVPVSQVYPDYVAGAVAGAGAGTLMWLGKDALAKAVGKPAWGNYFVAGAAAVSAALALYLTRNTVHGQPLTSKNSPPLPAQPNFLQSVKAFNQQNVAMFAERSGTSASLAADFNAQSKASTAPSTTSLIELAETTHVFTVREIQYLLNLWKSNPLPAVTGTWDDTTVKAVRDYQTRENNHYNIMDVTGDPFDARTSYSLHMFAKDQVTKGNLGQAPGGIGIFDLQTLIGVPNTGILDATTQAKLNQYAPLLYPPSPPGTQLSPSDPRVQTLLRGLAKTRASFGGGLF